MKTTMEETRRMTAPRLPTMIPISWSSRSRAFDSEFTTVSVGSVEPPGETSQISESHYGEGNI